MSTLKEKFLPMMYCFFGSGMLTNSYDEKVAEDNAKQCENIADDYAIEVLLSYHNSLFFLELKEDEAKKILKHIKKQKGL
jgi:hypothetical protein